jgi:hypothetical protein
MKPAEREAWNARTPVVTVTEYCDTCKTLQPGVKLNFNKYPRLESKCCGKCWQVALREAQTAHDYYTDFGI